MILTSGRSSSVTRPRFGLQPKFWRSRSSISPDFPPGTDFHYCNTNYALLGLIAEKIEGKPLASCFQDRLFGPLSLKDTLLPATNSNTLPEPYSHGYGQMPGFNSKISYDPTNQLTLIIWSNLTVSLDGQQTANTLFVKMLDHVYVVSPLR